MKVYIKKPWKEILIWGFVSPSVMYMFIEIYSNYLSYNCLCVSFFSLGHLFQLFNLIRQSHRTEKQNL